jgi:quinol monooxygenase YgiN
MESPPLCALLSYVVKDERDVDQAIDLIRQVRERADVEEHGSLVFFAHRVSGDPRQILLYEQYRDQQSADLHRSKPYFRDIVENQLKPLMESRTLHVLDPFAMHCRASVATST